MVPFGKNSQNSQKQLAHKKKNNKKAKVELT